MKSERINKNDVYITILLFTIFILWLNINSQSLIGNAKLIHDSLLKNQYKTPFMSLLHQMENNLKKYEVV